MSVTSVGGCEDETGVTKLGLEVVAMTKLGPGAVAVTQSGRQFCLRTTAHILECQTGLPLHSILTVALEVKCYGWPEFQDR